MSICVIAIVSSYVPLLWQSVSQSSEASEAPAGSVAVPPGSSSAAPAVVPLADADVAELAVPPSRPTARPILTNLLLGVFVFGFALVAPLLAGPKNFFGWVIIGFSLWEAWKLTRAVEIPIRGPFRVGVEGVAARG